jgi:lysine biosynthesis protein LysW
MSTQNETKTFTTCPSCGQRIGLRGKVELGRRIVCTHCVVELKVAKAAPLTLSKAYRD